MAWASKEVLTIIDSNKNLITLYSGNFQKVNEGNDYH
jgi:hypothetical protein